MLAETEIPVEELVQLCAVEPLLFGPSFFPKTARMKAPYFHAEIWNLLEGPDRYVNILVYRGGAKTTILRMFAAKRVAYGVSKTILYVGKSQDHAMRSLRWLRLQIELNKKFASTFGLKKGAKWTDTEMQVINEADGSSTWLAAFGITGSTRGVNFDDYRPDLIIVDDIVDEENSATPEGRQKIQKLVMGALKESLAPRSEAPFAKLVILQTPQDFDDIAQQALRDPQFKSAKFGCWTHDTAQLPLEERESIWPERWPSQELRDEKLAALKRNTVSIFSREMECELVTPENAAFRAEWLHYYGPDEDEKQPPLHEMVTVLAIDPVPPPTEVQVQKGFANKDYEALAVVGKWHGKLYLLEVSYNRGHDPAWTIAEFFRLAYTWKIRKAVIEGVAYQRTLAWLIKQAMQRMGKYYFIETFDDKRSKYNRIVQGLRGVSSEGQFFISRERHLEFSSQFTHYPNVKYDDVIEAVAVAATVQQKGLMPGGDDQGAVEEEEENIKALENYRGAP